MRIEDYAEFVARTTPVVWIAGIPWEASRRILRPLAPPHLAARADRAEVRQAMRETKAQIALWHEEWDSGPCSWWYVICDRRDYSLDVLSSSSRRNVRNALRRCQVRQVEAQWLAQHGYEVYRAATTRYGGFQPSSEEHFRAGYAARAGHDGFVFYGAFVEGRLIAYLSCIVIEDAVLMSASKSHPDWLKHRPNNALQFESTRVFLRDRLVRYCSGGSRNILHETNMQEFSRSLGYRLAYCPLRVEVSPLLAAAQKTGVARWGRSLGLKSLAPGPFNNLAAVDQLIRLATHPDEVPATEAVASDSDDRP